ncbi:MAG TPA: glycosyltransferase family 4 protein [Chlamydiales bacterium]|nr:glycosyltransferase family 4 protein [Chlamydiales bacterium]
MNKEMTSMPAIVSEMPLQKDTKPKKHVVLLKSKAQQIGGLEKAASRIANAFHASGRKVTLLTTGNCQSYSSNISIVPFQTMRWPSFVRMEQFDSRVQAWLKNEKPDLIFGMDRNRFQTHFRAGNGVHIAYLKSRIAAEGKWKYLSCLINPMHRKILELERSALEHPGLQKVIANSHMVKRQFLEHYDIDAKKIAVIHNGVEWLEMNEAFSQKKTRNPNVFRFLFVGNGYLRKGLKILLEALSKMRSRDFHLSVVGKDNQLEWFRFYAAKLGLKNHVSFFGPVENITPFYQNSDALIIPSFYDPFANVTIEALAMGLFVVSSKHNGGHEVLHSENGLVIENLLEIDSVILALESCLSQNFSSQQIRNSVKHLDYSKQLNQLMDLCE